MIKTVRTMKTFNYLMAGGLFFICLAFQSCLDDDDSCVDKSYPNALVTVKQDNDKTLFLQLDDKTKLFPVNMKSSPFGNKEVRALVNFDDAKGSKDQYNKNVYVNWIDSIRTKTMVPDLGSQDDAVYGNDPVEIVNDWVTIVEDGYLTLRFRTVWGGDRTKIHYVNLLAGQNPNDPYEIEFRQNASGDVYGPMVDAIVAFKLDKLPDTKGSTVKLKLKWKSFTGNKTAEFDYCSGTSLPTKSTPSYVKNVMNVK